VRNNELIRDTARKIINALDFKNIEISIEDFTTNLKFAGFDEQKIDIYYEKLLLEIQSQIEYSHGKISDMTKIAVSVKATINNYNLAKDIITNKGKK